MLFGPLRLVLKLASLLVTVVVLYLAVTLVQVWLTSRRYGPQRAGAIVVMGAAQYDGVPSPDLKARLDEAALLERAGYAHLVVVTGGKEKGDVYTEAQAGARYLEAAGVPAADIRQAGGSDSYENVTDAAPIVKAAGGSLVTLMVTDPFHEDRSMAIASGLGLEPFPTPTRTSPITGWSTAPYFLKEMVGVGMGRVIGYHHLNQLHIALG
jgi:uncharacterized SAM-binding protein YcdF (DUF218 family)